LKYLRIKLVKLNMKIKWTPLFLVLSLLSVSFISCLDSPGDSNDLTSQEVQQIDEYINTFYPPSIYEVLYDNSTGIRFVFHQFGNDAPPREGQTVTVDYEGTLFSDGSSFGTGEINANLENITPAGLQYCISSLLKGAHATVFIPSKYGYGSSGASAGGVTIPGNSILIYKLYLADVTKTAAQLERFQIDTATIHNYIIDNSIENTIQHSSGMWYTVAEEGSGDRPTPYDVVTFDYKLRLLSAPDAILQENTLTNQFLFELIDGFKIAVPLIRTGGTATFYIPSGLAYGTTANGSIPANSILIFEIKLTSIAE
jgi:FKBP-type peptidyl-prolyl cis-trans isomerase FkpA